MSVPARSSCQPKDKGWIIYKARNPFFLRGVREKKKSRFKLFYPGLNFSPPFLMAPDINKPSILFCMNSLDCADAEQLTGWLDPDHGWEP